MCESSKMVSRVVDSSSLADFFFFFLLHPISHLALHFILELKKKATINRWFTAMHTKAIVVRKSQSTVHDQLEKIHRVAVHSFIVCSLPLWTVWERTNAKPTINLVSCNSSPTGIHRTLCSGRVFKIAMQTAIAVAIAVAAAAVTAAAACRLN